LAISAGVFHPADTIGAYSAGKRGFVLEGP
jgi:hypothetical protein